MLSLVFFALISIAYSNRGPFIGGIDNGMNLIPTPHGLRPSKCVIRHDSNDVMLDHDETGTTAYYRDTGETKFFPVDPDCVKQAKELFADGGLQNLKAWDIDASYTPPGNMGSFNATYTIPNESPPCTGGSLLYWFIGFQNNDGSGTGVTIVQPVVNYQYNKWVMEPWNCCPSGQSNTGKQIAVGAGYSFPTWIDANGNNVAIGMSYGSQQSVLTVKQAGRNFDWMCVTLEEYGASCTNYPDKAFLFTDMEATTLKGANVDARWRANRGSCNGGAIINSSAVVEIYGKNMP